MPEGGTLRVILEEQRKFAVLRIGRRGFRDSGRHQGEDLRSLFHHQNGGSGIGLAMTYRILQLHYGSIEVQSRPERGTEFLLRIPLAARNGASAFAAGKRSN